MGVGTAGILLLIYYASSLSLSVASVVIGSVNPGVCDIHDISGLSGGKWLLGLGIVGIFTTPISIFLLVRKKFLGIIAVSILTSLFSICWFIVGGVVLFLGNVGCIKVGSATIVFTIIMWIIDIVGLFCKYHSTKN